MKQIPSLKEYQDLLNAMCDDQSGDGSSASNDAGLTLYDHSSVNVHFVETREECNRKINAMLVDMKEKKIGLDAEWNVETDGRGLPTGPSKIMTIQMAYRDGDNKMQVLIVRTGKWTHLPERLTSLLCDDSMKIAGVNVSNDLNKIARDFDISGMKNVDQKSRINVFNLSTYARKRDVIQDGKQGSMVLLGERVLGIKVNKSQQISDWSGKLSDEQINYAAEDAAISLELFEKLEGMPDLTRRLSVEELSPGKKVDLVPQQGPHVLAAPLNTRAATATVIGTQPCHCPAGIVPKNGTGARVKPGANSYVVKVDNIYAPAFIIPGYKKKDTNECVSLGDVGSEQKIVVPVAMLREHIVSDAIRPTPAPTESQNAESAGPSPTASESSPKRVSNKKFSSHYQTSLVVVIRRRSQQQSQKLTRMRMMSLLITTNSLRKSFMLTRRDLPRKTSHGFRQQFLKQRMLKVARPSSAATVWTMRQCHKTSRIVTLLCLVTPFMA
jgi:hypothetical protein